MKLLRYPCFFFQASICLLAMISLCTAQAAVPSFNDTIQTILPSMDDVNVTESPTAGETFVGSEVPDSDLEIVPDNEPDDVMADPDADNSANDALLGPGENEPNDILAPIETEVPSVVGAEVTETEGTEEEEDDEDSSMEVEEVASTQIPTELSVAAMGSLVATPNPSDGESAVTEVPTDTLSVAGEVSVLVTPGPSGEGTPDGTLSTEMPTEATTEAGTLVESESTPMPTEATTMGETSNGTGGEEAGTETPTTTAPSEPREQSTIMPTEEDTMVTAQSPTTDLQGNVTSAPTEDEEDSPDGVLPIATEVPVEEPVETTYAELEDVLECSPESPCTVCTGDCNTDEDCMGDLACYRRPGIDFSPVPGCLGPGTPGKDYCYIKSDEVLHLRHEMCTVEAPCAACTGDCHSDDQCEGDLKCFFRTLNDVSDVPGCKGRGIPGLDYCFQATETDGDKRYLRGAI